MISTVCRALEDFFYPSLCVHCEESLNPQARLLCPVCADLLELIDPQTRCVSCFSPGPKYCKKCSHTPSPLYRTAACWEHWGPAATLVQQMKYGNQAHHGEAIAGYLVAQLIALDWPLPDVIVPVPTTLLKTFERGYNPPLLIAEQVAILLNRPIEQLLKRKLLGYSQAGLSKEQRLELPDDSYFLHKRAELEGKTVLIIDDVLTTGTTLSQCASALIELFPKAIYGMTATIACAE